MAKRFTDTEKWKKPFIRSIKAPYKLLWLYILDECNHAGIWDVDFEVAQLKIGEKLKESEAIDFFRGKIVLIDNKKKWFIPAFIEFQYGELNFSNRAHKSAIDILRKEGLISSDNKIDIGAYKDLTGPFEQAMDMDKEKEMDKEKIKVKEPPKIEIPTEEEFLNYCKEQIPETYYGLEFSLKAKRLAWIAADWKDGNGSKITNWKTKILNTIPYLNGTNKNQPSNATSQNRLSAQPGRPAGKL